MADTIDTRLRVFAEAVAGGAGISLFDPVWSDGRRIA